MFSSEERDAIAQRRMLSDESINLAQNLLHEQFPHLFGLVDTSIGKWREFDIVPSDEPYVQILHAGSLHWVCVANVGEKVNNQHHYLYDSLTSPNLKRDVVEQIAAYSFCHEDTLHIEAMTVQQQNNGVDCGLFAIAFATSLWARPLQHSLRFHFVKTTLGEVL